MGCLNEDGAITDMFGFYHWPYEQSVNNFLIELERLFNKNVNNWHYYWESLYKQFHIDKKTLKILNRKGRITLIINKFNLLLQFLYLLNRARIYFVSLSKPYKVSDYKVKNNP